MSTTTARLPFTPPRPPRHTLSDYLTAHRIDHWTEGPTVVVPAGTGTVTVHPVAPLLFEVATYAGPHDTTVPPTTVREVPFGLLVHELTRVAACRTTTPAPVVAAAAEVAADLEDRAALARLAAAERTSRARYLSHAPTRQGRRHRAARTRLTPRGEAVSALVGAASIVGTLAALDIAAHLAR